MSTKPDLQKMLLISPKVFENLKQMLLTNEKTKIIDKNLKTVLKNKRMNDYDKWNLYRHNQFHHANIKRKNNYGVESQSQPANIFSDKTKIDASTNTRRRFYKNAETEISGMIPSKNTQTQTDISLSGSLPEKIFENLDYDSFHDAANQLNASEEEYDVNDQTLDYSDITRDEALEGKPRNVRILSKLQSSDPARFSLYKLSDGSEVEVAIPLKSSPKMATRARQKETGIKLTSPLRHFNKRHKKESTPKRSTTQSRGPNWAPYMK